MLTSLSNSMRAVADGILERGRALGHERLGAEGYDDGRWVLLDFNDVIVHIFQEDVRGDAAVIDFDESEPLEDA